MDTNDDFSSYYSSLISGRYDSVDRIVLDGYFILAQQAGGLRRWWRDLTGSDDTLDDDHLHGMAGTFSRRVHAHCAKSGIPVIHCPTGTDKHRLAESHLPTDPGFVGVFLVLVAKAPALVWKVERERGFHIYRRKPWPYVNHYHFHIVDPEWGHMTIKMSGYPPFGVQIMLNGHEWVERQARKLSISSLHKEGNCFVAGSDFPALDRIADGLRGSATATRATSSSTAATCCSNAGQPSTRSSRASATGPAPSSTCPRSRRSSVADTARRPRPPRRALPGSSVSCRSPASTT